MTKTRKTPLPRTTFSVAPDIFQQVYDSPRSLPGKFCWLTSDADVRRIEKLLGIAPNTIGAPLWVSGDSRNCPKCGREVNWLDIVSSALAKIHSKDLLLRVILGEKKFVNVEAPKAIADLNCFKCKMAITNLRSFKCHNWVYARKDLLRIVKNSHQDAAQ